MSTIRVANVHFESTGTNRIDYLDDNKIRITSANTVMSGDMSVSGNVAIAGTMSMGSSFMRNKIINGDMRIDQRNNGAAVTAIAGGIYTVDRWQAFEGTDGTFTVQRDTDAPSGFTNSLKVIITLADTSLASTQYATIEQRIEGYNVSDLAWGTSSAVPITVSFWIKSSIAGTYAAAVRSHLNTRTYVFTYTINQTNTWEYKTATISGETTGTWATDNASSLKLTFNLGMGSTYQTTAGVWASAEYASTPGTIDLINTLNATWQITGVQLEAGTVATPFERRQYGQELALCQRYCLSISQTNILGQAFGATSAAFYHNLPVTMRTTPIFSTTSGFTSSTAGGGTVSITPSPTSLTGGNVFRIDGTGGSSMTAGNATILAAPAGAFLNAEL